ncbi:MAG: hypothetical protein PHE86_01575 [Candidatus Marinimicrobia bacterium]|nr:hypothetical protein [Candidatus Neomarinimicrobiota bacterium]
MIHFKTSRFIFLLSLFSGLYGGIFELYGTGSYGINNSAASFGRGGTSIAYTDTLTSTSNPALLAHIQFTELEAGLNGRFSYISDYGFNESTIRFNYANLIIPIRKKGGFQLGINPLSTAHAEYQIKTSYITEIIKSSGDIYDISLGFGYAITPRFFAGISFEMLAGSYLLSNQIRFTNENYYTSERYYSKGIDGRRITLGTAWQQKNLSFAFTYSYPYTMKYKTLHYDSYNNYLYNNPDDTTFTHDIILPQEFAVGATCKFGQRHYIVTDYKFLKMQDVSLLKKFNPINVDYAESASHYLSLGYERRGAVGLFVPFFESLTYRAGLFYEKNGLSTGYESYGMSAGIGIPFNNFKNRVDVGFHYGLNSGVIYNNIELNETFFQLKISINSLERWFNTRGKYR